MGLQGNKYSACAVRALTLTQQSTSQTLDSDFVLVMVNHVDLIGHTPETAPFVRQPIPFTNEENPGVYIRRNGDDDNANGTPDRNDTNVSNENDLILVTLATAFAAPAGVRFELEKSSADIRIWTSSTKGTELLATQNPNTITFPNGVPASVWVEWVTPGTGTAQANLDFRLEDAVSNNVVFTDRLVFHPFTSIVIALGGEGQVPSDPADPNHGTFQSAIDLYREGYDVHMYDEDDVNEDGSGAVYNEIVSAIQNRGVTSVAVFGYSHGGGSVQELSVRLDNNRAAIGTFQIGYTAYIDAVDGSQSPNPSQETQRPSGTLYHLNIYQENGPFELGGGPLDNPQPQDEEINVTQTTWGVDLGHGDIDDHLNVRDAVKDRLRTRISR